MFHIDSNSKLRKSKLINKVYIKNCNKLSHDHVYHVTRGCHDLHTKLSTDLRRGQRHLEFISKTPFLKSHNK